MYGFWTYVYVILCCVLQLCLGGIVVNLLEYPFDPSLILQKKRSLKRELSKKEGLIPKKIALLSGSTIGEVKNILELFLLENGIQPTFYEGGYSLFYENIVFDDGSLANFQPDFIYIHTSWRNLKNLPSQMDSPELCQQKLDAEYSRFEQVWKAAQKFGCPIIQNNFDLPVYRVMGNLDAVDVHGKVRFIRKLNDKMAEYAAATPNFYINDLAYLQAVYGMEQFSSQTAWYAYKYLCSIDCIPYLAQSVANIIKSLLGKNKKLVACDLDNTLWGGIIGDDGTEGIVMGNETPTGMAYTEFQSYLKELSAMGVLLSVCSKNEETNAAAGFTRGDSVLKRDDFVSFKANWEPKHLNLAQTAKEINILPDSFVFMDDNPAEREIVRRELAGVSVPELTAPEEYIKAIDRMGYFEVTLLSADDRKRAEMYKQNQQRAVLEQSFGNYEDYLHSLEMVCDIGAFSPAHAERITQLINKTNQFNLTTRRYTAAEVETVMNSPEYITLFGKLVDKFGDNGIVTAMIGHIVGDTLEMDLWIMSCRTFKRQLEHAMFDEMVRQAAEKGIRKIVGHYYPTAKNLLVSDFYATIGFNKVSEDEKGNKTFEFTGFEGYQPQCNVMKIQRV